MEVESEPKDSENKIENKMILIEAGNKMMLLKPVEIVTQKPVTETEAPVVKVEVEGAPVKIMPEVVQMMMTNSGSLDTVDAGLPDKVEQPSNNKTEIKQDQESEKVETAPDSDVASSYYHHSRIYYVGFWVFYLLSYLLLNVLFCCVVLNKFIEIYFNIKKYLTTIIEYVTWLTDCMKEIKK